METCAARWLALKDSIQKFYISKFIGYPLVPPMFTPKTNALLSINTISQNSHISDEPVQPVPIPLVNPILPTIVFRRNPMMFPSTSQGPLELIMGSSNHLIIGSLEYERTVKLSLIFLKSANKTLIRIMTTINERIETIHPVPPHFLGIPNNLGKRSHLSRHDPAIAIHKFRNAIDWGHFLITGVSHRQVHRALSLLQESRNKCGHIEKNKLLADAEKFLSCIHFLSGPNVLDAPAIAFRAKNHIIRGKMSFYPI